MFFQNAAAAELSEPPPGPAPTLQAEEVEVPDFEKPSFKAPQEEVEPPKPNHPPINLIPPMPMPDDSELPTKPASEGGNSIYLHNVETGATSTLQVEPEAAVPLFGGAYNGPDGAGTPELETTFSYMSLITNPGIFPWRMNAKLVMRYGDSWFVCSGTMRDAEVVLTAGHCVYNRDTSSFADEIWVYPGYDGSQWGLPPGASAGAYGFGSSNTYVTWAGYTISGDYNYDLGYIQLSRAVGMLTGWFGYFTSSTTCSDHTVPVSYNVSYPAETCPDPGLHNGLDMYYWYGNFDSCVDWNRLQLDTLPAGGDCFGDVWGGMSGSGAYFIIDGKRYVHAVASTSDRSTWGRYVRQFADSITYLNDVFVPSARGSVFDLQALDANAEPSVISPGGTTTLLNHLAVNPTNNDPASNQYFYRVYLSTNDYISNLDTFLSYQTYTWDFAPMQSLHVNMVQVTIPTDTPPGQYWIGVLYDTATDGVTGNNATNYWDAVPIVVEKDFPWILFNPAANDK